METLTAITTHIAQVGIELLDIVAMGILLYGTHGLHLCIRIPLFLQGYQLC